MNNKLFAFLIIGVFLLAIAPTVSAGFLDGKNSIDTKGQDYDMNGDKIKYNKIWEKYKPIEIKNFFGKIKKQVALTEHTDFCGNDETCLSVMKIYQEEEGVLVEDIIFETLQDGSWVEEDIRWYQLQYTGMIDDYETQCTKGKPIYNGTNESYIPQTCKQIKVGSHEGLINYNLGDILPAGTYDLQLTGEKKPSRTVDWKITTEKKLLSSLAVWGG